MDLKIIILFISSKPSDFSCINNTEWIKNVLQSVPKTNFPVLEVNGYNLKKYESRINVLRAKIHICAQHLGD